MRRFTNQSDPTLPLVLAVIALFFVVALLASDAAPRIFPARLQSVLSWLPLVLIAVAYILYQSFRRIGWKEMSRSLLLSAAFFVWAANQFWTNTPAAPLLDDLAITLFVLDVVLVIASPPR